MARSSQHRQYPRTGSAVETPLIDPLRPGTPIYNWRFLTPWGWIGGETGDKYWTPNKHAVLAMFEHCDWPCEILIDVVR